MIKVYAFKENKKEGSEERPPTWWPIEGSKLNGPLEVI
jgi:hypothetical protein